MTIPDHPTAVLLDLDGTVTDSAPGVTASILAALEQLGVPAPPRDRLRDVVGPPLAWSFEHIAGVHTDQIERAQDLYREHYGAGSLFDADVFPGMRDILERLRAAGIPVSLATSKAEEFARRILDHFGLAEHFTAICGAEAEGRNSDKAFVISNALRELRAAGADTSRSVMVGDREHDVAGARAHDLPCVLVAWGYGDAQERASADAVATTPADLARMLGVGAAVGRPTHSAVGGPAPEEAR